VLLFSTDTPVIRGVNWTDKEGAEFQQKAQEDNHVVLPYSNSLCGSVLVR